MPARTRARRLALGIALLLIAPAARVRPNGQTASADPTTILGTWRGVAVTGGQSEEVAVDIRTAGQGVGLYLTLPRLHAWGMPIDYLQPAPERGWTIPGWHIAIRRAGERLVGELGDPRVRFELTRTDVLPAEQPLPTYPPGPSPAWTYDAGAPLWGSPTALDGVAYVGDVRGHVHAVKAADGAAVWKSGPGAPIYGAPLVTADALFLFDDAGVLRRLDRRTGRDVWRAELGADPSPRVLPAATVFAFDFHAPAPVLRQGSIYISSPLGVMHAVGADSGRVEWRADLKSKVRATAAVSDTHVFVGTLDNDLVALDRVTGAQRWRVAMTGPVTSAPTIAGDLVLIASRGSWTTALRASTGAQAWARYEWFSWVESDGVLSDGLYYVGSSDLRLVRALDPRTGEPLWETDVLGWAWGMPAVTGDAVYVGVAGPQKYVTRHQAGLVALDRRTGAVRWRRPVASDPSAFVSGYPGSVIVVGSTLVAPNVSGTLEGYRLQ
jgi:outer membrane protein assembly factor BamB